MSDLLSYLRKYPTPPILSGVLINRESVGHPERSAQRGVEGSAFLFISKSPSGAKAPLSYTLSAPPQRGPPPCPSRPSPLPNPSKDRLLPLPIPRHRPPQKPPPPASSPSMSTAASPWPA